MPAFESTIATSVYLTEKEENEETDQHFRAGIEHTIHNTSKSTKTQSSSLSSASEQFLNEHENKKIAVLLNMKKEKVNDKKKCLNWYKSESLENINDI